MQIVEQLIAGPEKNMLKRQFQHLHRLRILKLKTVTLLCKSFKRIYGVKLANVTKQTTVYSVVDSGNLIA